MDAEQKKRIIKRYIKEKSVKPADVNLGDDALAPYAALDRLLDYIDIHNHGLFDFATLEADNEQWKKYVNIIDYATKFTPGSPPVLTQIRERSADFGLQYWRNARDILALPKDNYYARPTSKPVDVDADLTARIQGSRIKLYALCQAFPGATAFNASDITQVNARISALKEQIKPLTDNDPQKAMLQKRLNILADLNKINQLERINIPQNNGPALTYCTLTESAGGVTEKVSLISLARVRTQLGNINAKNDLTVDNYDTDRAQFKLSTEAIIKLPKHGNIKEVQREAMALNISRLMGLDTSSSTTITHNGHPAMFVPFDDIRLLSDFSSGKTFTAGLGFGGQTYTHYSTIKPVGDGVQGDRFVTDFGNSLALFYLCSDTDAVGGYCQNKALRDSRNLFIFDQVIMDSDKFILDSRLSLQPDQFIMKHTRHGQGRNRTLIEDSSMITKYASLMQLKDISNKIIQYTNHVAWTHHNKAAEIKDQLRGNLTAETRGRLNDELIDIEILERDASTIKTKIEARINKINEVLPQTTGIVSSDEVRQTLILEKLLHNPVLFSDDGRPYKNPWTTRQANPALTINDLANGSVQITFDSKVPPEMVHFIKRQGGGDSLTITSPKVITISKVHLNALSEGMLHPENNLNLAPNTNYLAANDLSMIKEAYSKGNRTEIIAAITVYKAEMINGENTPDDKIAQMTQTENDLKEFIRTAKDKGFGMHVLKKFYFDAQQELQKLMNPAQIPANLNQAFSAALKLDRVAEFNAVVREAIAHNKLNNAQFTGFLTASIQKEALATNHTEAVRQSQALLIDAQRVVQHLELPPVPIIVQLQAQAPVVNALAQIDPLAALEADLMAEHDILLAQPIVQASGSQPVTELDHREEITVRMT
ncbi:hypothetical protein [uncultured Legionella sp.]|uniref:hypothetical protein n=1 Tax=uncultured Legionella sp. TaxID=210934 RepID=UPI00261E128B|nr:hypothetical protein [uncultured Legionella sp.]